eukprot:gb/GFBE01058336.1/.p1 GENE.gb/GFBE01058336.1/~~gb/GFBE01058336.1/.p1  ORF type:complete len:267 (+),score=89.51 gb/GFBE01058336.1/:1-801(+)
MDNYDYDKVCKATAQLRIQHDIEAKAREGPRVDPGPRDSDMTVGEALLEIEDNMMSDKFWVDLGQGVLRARQALQGEEKDGQTKAAEYLKEVSDQILALDQMYFAGERKVIDQIRDLFEKEEPVSLSMPLSGVRTTRSEGQEYSSNQDKRFKELAKLGKEVIDKQEKQSGPWEFIEVKNEIVITVNIKVPPSTSKGDVTVNFHPSKLKVVVKGHEVQPAVIDGEMTGEIDVEASGWNLEGKDDDRRLVLELEKTMGGFMWYQLMKT